MKEDFDVNNNTNICDNNSNNNNSNSNDNSNNSCDIGEEKQSSLIIETLIGLIKVKCFLIIDRRWHMDVTSV